MYYTHNTGFSAFVREKRLECEVYCYLILVPGIKYVEPNVHFAIRLDIALCLTCLLLSPQPRDSRINVREDKMGCAIRLDRE